MAPPLATFSSSSTSTITASGQDRKTPARTHRTFDIFAAVPVDHAQLLNHDYAGSGFAETPFLVEFLPDDPQDATTFSMCKKWMITTHQAVATLAVTFASSAYSGGIKEIIHFFGASHEVATLGVSLYVLGFALGPLVWAPFSELYGRQRIFIVTLMAITAFNAGCAGTNTISALLVLRFFAGACGSSTLTNAGGVIADMFEASQRGLATSVFAMAPFLGPAIGPIIGGFLGETEGWRWLHGLMAIFTGVLWLLGTIFVPETYAPVLLRRRARLLSEITGNVYISTVDAGKPPASLVRQCKTALTRPWILLFKEPIVLFTSVYIGIIYGTLYLNFAGYPIIFQQDRGWSPGIGGLPFIGTAVGVVVATLAAVVDNTRFKRLAAAKHGMTDPEDRLPPAMVGSILIPVGLFWFAWTCDEPIHWVVPIVGSAVFACGVVVVFMSLLNYLIDSYVIFAASILAANSVLRSIFGAAFPLFTQKMYENLGNHWASSVPAFLAVACVPFPFLCYKYGGKIRMNCEYAAEAAKILEKMCTRQARKEGGV